MREPGPAERSWGTPNAVLLVLLVALALLAWLFSTRGPGDGGSGSDAAATTLSARQRAVTAAAKTEATAFLTVDHRSAPAQVRAVLAGATGDFARSYRAQSGELVRMTQKTRATATPTLRAVGVGTLDAGRATVLVAADSTVRNSRTGGQAQPRYYRLRLEMVRERGRWLTSGLELVG